MIVFYAGKYKDRWVAIPFLEMLYDVDLCNLEGGVCIQ